MGYHSRLPIQCPQAFECSTQPSFAGPISAGPRSPRSPHAESVSLPSPASDPSSLPIELSQRQGGTMLRQTGVGDHPEEGGEPVVTHSATSSANRRGSRGKVSCVGRCESVISITHDPIAITSTRGTWCGPHSPCEGGQARSGDRCVNCERFLESY